MLNDIDRGTIAIWLACTFPNWVRRRKTSFEFVDENVFWTRQRVEFRLGADSFPDRAVPAENELIYVPIHIASKDPLTSYTAFDEAGCPVTLLNRSENNRLAADGLSAYMDGKTAGDPTIALGAYRRLLFDLVHAPDEDSGDVALQAVVRAMGVTLASDPIVQLMLEDLRRGFLMLVPITYHEDEYRTLRIEFVAPYPFSARGAVGSLLAMAASLGFRSKSLRFLPQAIGWSEGSHFEVHQPDEVRLVSGRLGVHQFHPVTRQPAHEPRRRVVYGKPVMNLNVTVLDPEQRTISRGDSADLELRMRPQTSGTFLGITLTAVLSAMLLGFVESRLAQLDGQTMSAMLLVVPALLFGYLARPGEHAIATRLLSGVRVLGTLAALAALCGAALIGSGDIREAALPTHERLDCRAVRAPARPAAARRGVQHRMRCAIATAPAPEPKVKPSAQQFMDALATLANASAALLLMGACINAAATSRARRRSPESRPIM